MSGSGRLLILAGIAITLFGVMLVLFGRLPGTLVLRRGEFTLVLPLLASLVISAVLTLLLNLLLRGR